MRKTSVALIAVLAAIGLVGSANTVLRASHVEHKLPNEDLRPATISTAHLAEEVAKLKQEVRQLKLEYQQLRVASLERELLQITADRLVVRTESTLLQQDLQELDEHLSQPLDNESYFNLSTLRSNMTEGRAAVLDAEQQKAAQRETELVKSLHVARQKLQALSQ